MGRQDEGNDQAGQSLEVSEAMSRAEQNEDRQDQMNMSTKPLPGSATLSVGLLLSILLAIPPQVVPAATTPNPRSMEVQVIEEATGQPVAGVVVLSPFHQSLLQDPANSAASLPHTDQNGKLRLTIPEALNPPGQFYLAIQASNYPALNLNWSSPTGGPIRDRLPASHVVRLPPRSTVGGWVRDSQGRPVVGAKVMVWGYDQNGASSPTPNGLQVFQQFHLPREPHGAVETDQEGRWRFDRYPSGLSFLTVDVIQPGGALTSFVTPSSQNFGLMSRGSPIDLESLLNTNATLVLKPGFTLRGVITDSRGAPVPHAIIQEQIGMDMAFHPIQATNGLDGRFELKDRSYRRGLLKVAAAGYALALHSVEPKPEAGEIRVSLQPQKPIRIQVLTAEGQPVESARISTIPHRSGVYASWEATTDHQGAATWTNAPLEELFFWINSPRQSQPRSIKVPINQREQTVRMPAGSNAVAYLKVRAQDEDSGQPLATFTVKRRQYAGMPLQPWGEGKQGEFTGQLSPSDPQGGMGEGWLVDVDAPGHLAWKSEMIYADAGDQEIAVRLRKAVPVTGRVLQPSGQPASQASLILNTQDWGVYSHQPGVFQASQGAVSAKCDVNGNFSLAPSADDRWVVITHSTGFFSARLSELQKNSTVTLQAWARVEGILKIGGKPAKSANVSVRTPLVREGSIPYQATYSQVTDAAGRFVFTNLPPGNYLWYRQPRPIMGAPVVESHPFPFDLKPAEAKTLELPTGGRIVQGAFQTSDEVDWFNDAHTLQLKIPPPPDAPLYNDFTSPKEFEVARKAYADSPELKEYQRQARQYQLEMDSTGGFRIADVPPGSYLLKVNLTQPPPPGQHRMYNGQSIGTLEKDIVIPPGEGLVDLGEFDLAVRSPGTKPSAPLDLPLLASDDKPLKLSSLRGKPVVVTLWADWALGARDHLKKVDTARGQLQVSNEVAFVAVNLDEDQARASAAPTGVDQQWTLARVHGRDRLTWIDQVGFNTLPFTLVLDARGRIVARDVAPDRLKSGLVRAQKRSSMP